MRRLALALTLLLLGGCSARSAPPPAPGPAAGAGPEAGAAPAPATQAGVRCGGAPLPGEGQSGGDLATEALPGPTGGLQHLHAGPDWLLGITYDRLFASGDGGRTWQEIPAPKAPYGLSDAVRLPGGALLAAALDGQLYRSDDQGRSWQPVAAVPRAMGITVDGQTVFVAGRQVPPGGSPLPAIYRSDDGGRSWSVSSQGFWPGRANTVARDPADPSTLYAGVGDYDLAQRGGGLFKSSDGGRTWRQASQGLPGWPTAVFAAGGRVYARTNEGLYRSDDGAATWQPVPGQWWYADGTGVQPFDEKVGGLEVQAIAFDPGSGRLVAATEGGVFTRPAAGGEWEQGGAGLPTLRLRFALPYATAGRALFRDGRFTGALPAPDLTLAVSPANPDHLWALPGYESTDGGRHWSALPPGPKVGGPALALDDQVLLARGEHAYLLRSGDGGRTWAPAGEVVTTGLSRGPGGGVWAISDHGLYKSEDGGRSWQWSGVGLPSLLVWGISPDPADPQQAVALTDHGLACTTDGGATWQTAIAPVAPPYEADTRVTRSPGGRLFFAQDKKGVWALDGEAWRQLDLPAPEGLQDLVAPADDQVAVSEFWDTQHRRLTPPPAAVSRLALQPAPAPAARWYAPAGGGAMVSTPLLYSNDASVALTGTTQGNLWLTRDGGRTWAPAGKLEQGTPHLDDATLPNGTYAPLAGGLPLTTRDGGRTWSVPEVSPQIGEPDALSVSPDPRDPQVLVAVFSNPLIMGGGSGLLRSTDGGKSWQQVYAPAREPGKPLRRVGRLLRDPANPDRLWASGDLIVVSQDGGATWQEAGEGAIFGADNAGRLYGSVGRKPVRSGDGGKSWEPIPLPAGVDPGSAAIQPDVAHPGGLFLLGAPRGLWYTPDGGQSWTDLAASIGDPGVRAVAPAGPDGWYVQTTHSLLFRLELS